MLKERESLWEYICKLAGSVPLSLYVILALVTLLVILVVFRRFERAKAFQLFARLLSIEYIALLYSSTIVFRETQRFRKYNLYPFWSYEDFSYHANEILMNIVVFIPFGFILGVIFRTGSWIKVTLSGMVISLIIELMQITFKKGYAEVDDVMHNTTGCLLGFAVYLLVIKHREC